MNINLLYDAARLGDEPSENRLFSALTVSFRLIAQRRIVEKQQALEVAQEALLTVVAKYKDEVFDHSFSSWAHRILINKIMDYYKSKKVRQDYEIARLAQAAGTNAPTPNPLLKIRLINCLNKLLAVNKRYARVLSMAGDGYRTDEICAELAITRNHFYVLLSRARKLLTTCLESEGMR